MIWLIVLVIGTIIVASTSLIRSITNGIDERCQRESDKKKLQILMSYISKGKLPVYQGNVCLIFKQDEYPILSTDAQLYEERSIGNYTGVSFRVAPGVYMRTGKSISHPS